MVIEESKRRADREGVQPQRYLGQLHRHRFLVRSVYAALEHRASDDMMVVERQPIGRPHDGLGEKIAREQVALECLSDTHLRTAWDGLSLQAEPSGDANGSRARTIRGRIPEAMAGSEPVLSSPDRDLDTPFLGPAHRTVPEYDAWMSPLSRK